MDNKEKQVTKQSQRKKRSEISDISTKIVLNLRYENFEPQNDNYLPKFRKKQYYIDTEYVNILDQNRFKFILNSQSNFYDSYTSYYDGDFSNIEWKDIKIVLYYCVEEYQCPICLESSMICPMITRCGHVFCWPCLESYYSYSTTTAINKKIPKCPLCSHKINIKQDHPKFCEIFKCHNYTVYDENEICFNLITREKAAPSLYNIYYDPDLSKWENGEKRGMREVPFEENLYYSFGRVFYSNKNLIGERLKKYKKELENGLEEELGFYADQTRINFINLCIDEIKNIIAENENDKDRNREKDFDNKGNINVKEENKQKKVIFNKFDLKTNEIQLKEKEKTFEYNKHFFFYQEKNGDVYYLHPLIYDMLLWEYEKESQLPTEISGVILDIELVQISPFIKTREPYLSHLRTGSLIFFVEIDISHLISQKTKKIFSNQLRERAKHRRLLENEEKNYEKFIKKKELKEMKEIEENQRKYMQFKEMVEMNKEIDKEKEEKQKKEEEEKEKEKEKEKEELKEKKESELAKLFNSDIEEEERKKEEERKRLEEITKQEKEKEKEKRFKFTSNEFPELSVAQGNIKKGGGKKSKRKNNKKFMDVSDEVFKQISANMINDKPKEKEQNEKKNKNEN